jgi:hypothetical protein
MGMYDGMGQGNMVVTVKKDELLAKLRENRAAHEAEYNKAVEGWHNKIDTVFGSHKGILSKAKLGTLTAKDVGRNSEAYELITDPPENYLSSYDTAISMLEWHTGDEMKIERAQFEQYILDKWNWKASFSLKNSAYI